MSNKQRESKKQKLSYLRVDNKSIVTGTIIATLIAITPYLFYLYESVPDVPVWDTFMFSYESTYYGSALTVAWTLAGKIIPLYLLFIWFFTCRHWWFHVLLVPIAMYAYQIFVTLNDDFEYVDDNQLIVLIPIMAIIVPSIYLIRARIFNKINEANKSLEELEEEFKMSPKGLWSKVKEYF